MAGGGDLFSKYGEEIVRALKAKDGAPTSTSPTELRWGQHGSWAYQRDKATWFDHEHNRGGGVWQLVEQAHGDDWPAFMLGLGVLDVSDRESVEKTARRKGGNGHDKSPSQITTHLSGRPPQILGDDGKALTRKPRQTATYCYDCEGGIAVEVIKAEFLDDKGFRQKSYIQRHRKAGSKTWINNLKGVPRPLPLYRQRGLTLPSKGDLWFIAEGEKDVERLDAAHIYATTNIGGSKNWDAAYNEAFRGHDVVLLEDNDKAGADRTQLLAPQLARVAKSVRVFNVADVWPDAAEKADISDWLARGGTAEELERICWRLPKWAPAEIPSTLGILALPDLFDPLPPLSWIVQGIIPAGERCLIIGEPQSGKSFCALDMGFHIATGRKYCGLDVAQGGVAYLAFEGGTGMVHRAAAMARSFGLSKSSTDPFLLVPHRVDLFGDGGDEKAPRPINVLISELQAKASLMTHPLNVIFVDTISAATPGMDENSGQEMGRFLDNIKKLKDAFGPGCAIILIHHKPKGGTTPRGSGKLTADLETEIDIAVSEDQKDDEGRPYRVATLNKQRDAQAGQVFTHFTLHTVDIGLDNFGKPATTCLVEHIPVRVQPSAVGKGLGLKTSELTMMKLIFKIIERYGDKVPEDFNAMRPRGVKFSVFSKEWLAEEEGFVGEMKAAQRNVAIQRLRRVIDNLKAKGVIGWASQARGAWMWLTDKAVEGAGDRELLKEMRDNRSIKDVMDDDDLPI